MTPLFTLVRGSTETWNTRSNFYSVAVASKVIVFQRNLYTYIYILLQLSLWNEYYLYPERTFENLSTYSSLFYFFLFTHLLKNKQTRLNYFLKFTVIVWKAVNHNNNIECTKLD